MNRSFLIAILSLSFPMLAAGQDAVPSGPVATLGGATRPATTAPAGPPRGVVNSVATHGPATAETRSRPPRARSSAPPPEITVDPGRNTVFSVALFHANRIITPFRNPEIRTSSTSLLTVESGIIYVTTQADDPIGLFVFDKSDPAQAISLTLMPMAISPVSVKINLAGWTPPATNYAVQGNPELARTWETEDPYVTTIKALFKDLALQKVPDGYGLTALNGRYPHMPGCNMPGAHVVPLQLVEGVEVTAVVARVTNTTYQSMEFNEGSCASDRMLGAAIWPNSTLAPGESAELYIAIRTPAADEVRSDRPSVVRGSIR